MKPNPTHEPAFGILKTGTTISDSAFWLDSLLTQIRELRRERKHPRPQVEITAERDPSALDKLVEMPSPVMSLFGDLREAIHDTCTRARSEERRVGKECRAWVSAVE